MIKTIATMAILVFCGNLFAQTGTIKLDITGINPKAGNNIRIAVYDETGFLEEMKIQKTIKSKGKTTYVELKEIEVGKYAIAVYQDENSDGKMNTNFMGKPKELSGFSNNAKGSLGPPSFTAAAFDVVKDKNTILTIRLE